MSRFTRLCLILSIILMALPACQRAESPPLPDDPYATPDLIVVSDALGREVTFDSVPDRIVIAGKANFMLNDAVYLFPQAAERVVALTAARQTDAPFLALLDPDYEDKVVLTLDSNAEEILATRPDVVLLKSFMADSLGAALTELGVPVVYLDLETPQQYQRDLATLGQLFDDPARATAVQSFYQAQLDRVAHELAAVDAAQRPGVLVLQYSDQGGEVAFKAPPASWIQTQMVGLAGGQPVWTEAAQGGGWAVVNLEQIAAWNPAYIFIINYRGDVDATVAQLRADPQWQALAATQAGRLYAFPKDYYSWDQPDTRWSLGLLWLTTVLQPDHTTVEMDAAIDQFYDVLYALDADTVDERVIPLLEGDVFVEQP